MRLSYPFLVRSPFLRVPRITVLARAYTCQARSSQSSSTLQKSLYHRDFQLGSRRSIMTRSFPNRPREFLQEYPNLEDDPSLNANVNFFFNKQSMRPDRRTFEQFMDDVQGDYDELEMNHSYIQWLFPIREHGVNPRAQPLQAHEAEKMSEEPEILKRILRSYTMMLDFYGIDFNDGQLKLARNYDDRFWNLSHAPHNLLRLTRILKFLTEIYPFQPHAAPLVLFFCAAHSEGLIDFTSGRGGYNPGGSMDQWWSGCFRDEGERSEVGDILRGRGECGQGKWGWEEYKKWMEKRKKEGKVGYTGEATAAAVRESTDAAATGDER